MPHIHIQQLRLRRQPPNVCSSVLILSFRFQFLHVFPLHKRERSEDERHIKLYPINVWDQQYVMRIKTELRKSEKEQVEFTNHLALTKRLGYIICKTCSINSNKLKHFETAAFNVSLSLSLDIIAYYFNVHFLAAVAFNARRSILKTSVDKNTRTHTIASSTFLCNDAHFFISLRFYGSKMHTRTWLLARILYNVAILISYLRWYVSSKVPNFFS